MKYLILINKRFPFDKGESFIENEVTKYADKEFQTVIFPISVCKEGKKTRVCPDSIKVYRVNTDSSRTLKMKAVTKGVRAAFSKKAKKSFLLNKYAGNIKNRVTYGYQYGMSSILAERIILELEKIDIGKNDEVFLYSYWLYTPAQVTVALKEYFVSKGIACKAVSRAHRFDIYTDNQAFGTEMMNGLDTVYACSDDGAEFLRKKYPEFSDKIETSFLGTIDHGYPDYVPNADKFVIVSCSRITDIKRVDRVAKALTLLDNDSSVSRKICWVHIGDGKDRIAIENYCRENLHNIQYEFKGFLPNTAVYDYYNRFPIELFVNVSSSEGLPVSIMEAMSFGIPVVATSVGGTSEVVENGYNGFTLDKDYLDEELADRIKFFVDMNNKDYMLYRKNARSLWERKCDADKNYSDFIERVFEE